MCGMLRVAEIGCPSFGGNVWEPHKATCQEAAWEAIRCESREIQRPYPVLLD